MRTSGALALVSGRSLNDIDLIFAPDEFRRRRPRRGNANLDDSEAVATMPRSKD